MKLFLFDRVEQLTLNYHSGGGLVVVAENKETAESMIAGDKAIGITPEEWAAVVVYEVEASAQPCLYVFPDAGCC